MIKQIQLGSTDIMVSRIGLGTVKFGRNQKINYPQPFELPSDKQIIELLDCAESLGINVLDTAPAYGSSEERLGRLLAGNRHRWVLSTKVGEEFIDNQSHFDFSPLAIQKSIQNSLEKLNTDYLDIVLVHSTGDDKKIIEQDAVFDTLQEIKKAGLIRAFGMSTKTIEGGMLAVDRADLVMVTYNLTHTEEQPVLAYAHQKNKGVFIKKALTSGHADSVQTAMQFVFQEPGVSSVIVGTLNPEHLKYNVACVE